MQQTAILLPVMSLVGWTSLTLLLVPYQRFKAAFAGQVKVEDFKLGESGNVPAHVSIPNRNYINLLEAPVLYYVVCICYFITESVGALAVALAWGYVGLRVLQSLVHLSYNNVFHRLAIFASSNLVLVALWLLLLPHLI